MVRTILEVGDSATPLNNVIYSDPSTNTEVELPVAGVAGTVIDLRQEGVDSEDYGIYRYSVSFSPAISVETTYLVTEDDGTETEEPITITVDEIWQLDYELGLAEDTSEVLIDDVAIQQQINEGKRKSDASLNKINSVASQVAQEDVSLMSDFGGQEIQDALANVQLGNTIAGENNVIGKPQDELKFAPSLGERAENIGSSSELFLEYVENLFAVRQYLQELDSERMASANKAQEQQTKADQEDTKNVATYSDTYLENEAGSNQVIADTDDYFVIPTEAKQESLDDLSEIMNNLNNSVLGPDSEPIPQINFTASEPDEIEEVDPSEPTSPEDE